MTDVEMLSLNGREVARFALCLLANADRVFPVDEDEIDLLAGQALGPDRGRPANLGNVTKGIRSWLGRLSELPDGKEKDVAQNDNAALAVAYLSLCLAHFKCSMDEHFPVDENGCQQMVAHFAKKPFPDTSIQ